MRRISAISATPLEPCGTIIPRTHRRPACDTNQEIADDQRSVSMRVRKKHSMASAGLQTMGSLSLKEVFTTAGTPVKLPNSRISFQYLGLASRSTVCKRPVPSICVGAAKAARFSGRTEKAKVINGDGFDFSKNSPVDSARIEGAKRAKHFAVLDPLG